MPFLQAGFNARNVDTGIVGWTRAERGHAWAVAELRRFECGDYFWFGDRPGKGSFLAWPERVVIGSRREYSLPWAWQEDLPQSFVETRGELQQWRPTPRTLEECMADA